MTHIAVGFNDQVYAINHLQDVWHYNGSGGNLDGKNWTLLPGVNASDISYGSSVWVVGW